MANDALVGLDLNQHLVANSHPYRIGYDRRDLKLCGHACPWVPSSRLASIDLQGQLSRTIEQVHALLVELEPDLLVRCDGDVRRHAYVDNGPGQ